MAASTALVPYDVTFATRDEQPGYTNYAMTESHLNYSLSESSSKDSAEYDDYYYSNSPTAMTTTSFAQEQMTLYQGHNNGTAVNPKHPRKQQMKRQRRRRTAGGAVGGAVVGGLVLGPVGAVFGGVGGAAMTRKLCRTGEKRAQRKFEHSRMQQNALEVSSRCTGSFA